MIADRVREKIKEEHILKDKWVKELLYKASDPEELASAIERRIKFPSSNGPFIINNQEEYPTDIIAAYVELLPEIRGKISVAVGLLLYKMIYNDIVPSRELLEGLFSLIDEAKLEDCHILLFKWLNVKADILASDDKLWKLTYRMGMVAFANIQPKNKEAEEYWTAIWNSDKDYFWGAAFRGLRRVNPALAAKELPRLIARDIDSTKYTLIGMWKDTVSRSHLEDAIKTGLATEEKTFAGIALNLMLDKLTEEHRTELMLALKE